MSKIEVGYKWKSVHEWLEWATKEGNIGFLDLMSLIRKLDADTIQDEFQDMMNNDHFFDQLCTTPCISCLEDILEADACQCSECGRVMHKDCASLHPTKDNVYLCSGCEAEDAFTEASSENPN